LDGAVTGVTVATTTTGSNGTASTTTFPYWSGAAAVSQSQLATNIATAINSNTTVNPVLTATANSPSTGNITLKAVAAGNPGNSYSISAGSFSGFSGAGTLSGGTLATVQPNTYPAKYGASLTAASCSDYVIYPTGLVGATGAANLIGYSNLYTGTCTGTVPSVSWAYNTGAGQMITTSPILSIDGTQVAFMESNGSAASLVVIKWATNTGESVTAPVTLTNSAPAAAFRSCTPTGPAPCMYTIAFGDGHNDTLSSAFYDYDGDVNNDALYVGDDSGYLHKFTGVFFGSPVEVTTAPWPLQLSTTAKLTSPVYDPASGNIFVGDMAGFLHSVSASAGTIAGTTVTVGDAIADAPLVDSSAGTIYFFVTTGNSTYENGLNAVDEISTGFGSGAAPSGYKPIGTGGAGHYLYSGTFDNVYYSSSAHSGNLYVIGNTGGVTTGATLYRIPIITSGMSTPVAAVTGLTATGAYPWPSEATEFCNNGAGSCTASATQTTAGTDYIFFSLNRGTQMGCTSTAGNGCIVAYNVTNNAAGTATPTLSGSGLNVTTPGTNGCWATGGLVIDNSSASAGASQIYFVNLAGAPAGGPTGITQTSSACSANTGVPTIAATQAQQSAP